MNEFDIMELEDIEELEDLDEFEDLAYETITMPPECVIGTRQGLVKKVTLRNFRHGSHRPTRINRACIRAIAEIVSRRHGTANEVRMIRLVGHTDHTGSVNYNLKLGYRRAYEVRRALIKMLAAMAIPRRHSFRMPTFELCSAGESQYDNSRTRSDNRRVDVILLTLTERS